jgi:hypothetical protein
MLLEEVVGMERRRIEAIRDLADHLASIIHTENSKSLLREVYEAKNSDAVVKMLNRLSFNRLKEGLKPSIRLDEYILIFSENEELARTNFRLAWNLIKMRVIERLFEFRAEVIQPEALKDLDIDTEGDE